MTATVPRAGLVKMSELAERSGVPAATIKHYVRESLIPPPARRSGRTMAWYDVTVVPRVRAIKRLQRDHFLPLRVIRDVLEVADDPDDELVVAAAIAQVLERDRPREVRTRDELVAGGADEGDLDLLESLGLLMPAKRRGVVSYGGDDVLLLRTLAAARRAGITREMLPPSILGEYARALGNLVDIEIDLFRRGVIPRAGRTLGRVTEAATVLSEKLVVQLRRRLLLPRLERAMREERGTRSRRSRRAR